MLVRCLPSQARRVGRNGCREKGVQRETCSGESVPRGPCLRLIGRRWLVSVRTSCRTPSPNERIPQVGCGSARLEGYVLRRRPRPEGDGIAKGALVGAHRIIAIKGGGTVDGYQINTRGKRYSSSFLWRGTESMFADLGFRRLGNFGSSKLVMRKVVRSR